MDHINFASVQYWEEYYNKLQRGDKSEIPNFSEKDWYFGYEQIRSELLPFIKKTSKLLIVGCGNSELSFKLYDEGYKDQVNIDISPTVIQLMDKEKQGRPIAFVQMDIRKLDFESNTFDAVIDKACLDAILTEAQSTYQIARDAQTEIYKVLKPGGCFMWYGAAFPNMALSYLSEGKWEKIYHGNLVDRDKFYYYRAWKGSN